VPIPAADIEDLNGLETAPAASLINAAETEDFLALLETINASNAWGNTRAAESAGSFSAFCHPWQSERPGQKPFNANGLTSPWQSARVI
jgi:hypothetical protein